MKKSPVRFLVAACIVVAGHLFVLGILTFGVTSPDVTERDVNDVVWL